MTLTGHRHKQDPALDQGDRHLGQGMRIHTSPQRPAEEGEKG